MNEADALLALDRIEQALARIEAAAQAVQDGPATREREDDLHRRHEALKASVARSLSDLDELLGQRGDA